MDHGTTKTTGKPMLKRTPLVVAIAFVLLIGVTLTVNAAVTRTSSPGANIDSAANLCTGADGAGGVTDTIAFTENSASISDVDVRVAIDHTWRGDLQFDVAYSGGGGTVVLAADHDGSADNYYATFDDEAATACGTVCGSAANCTAAPGPTCSPDSALTAFDGLTSPGTWTMRVCDDAGGDTGTWNSWAVTANGQPGDELPVELMEFVID